MTTTSADLIARCDDLNHTLTPARELTWEELTFGVEFVTRMDGSGERVLINAVDISDDSNSTVTITYPERTALDADGNETPYSYTMNAVSFLELAARESWRIVPLAVWTKQPRCEECNIFLPRCGGDTDLPWTSCDRCGAVYDDFGVLEDDGYVTGVQL